jgi:hypothetical protein
MRNSTRLCAVTVDAACLDVSSPNTCYDTTYLAFQSRNAPQGGASGPDPVAIGVPIAAGGAAALAVLVAALLLLQRSRRRRRAREAAAAAAEGGPKGGTNEGGYPQAGAQ